MTNGKISGGSKDDTKSRGGTGGRIGQGVIKTRPAAPPPRPVLPRQTPRVPVAKPTVPVPGTRPAPATVAQPRIPTIAERMAARRRLMQRVRGGFVPLPPPPARRPMGMPAVVPASSPSSNLNSATAIEQQQVQLEINQMRSRFTSLEATAQLSDIYNAIGHIDTRLMQLPMELDGLRSRGYVHAGQLEDMIAAVDQQWDEVRPRVEGSLKEQVARLDKELDQASQQVNKLAIGNRAGISAASTAITGVEQRINATRNAVQGLYGALAAKITQVDLQMDRIDWMLDQLEEGSFELRETEAPLAAAEAIWQESGESDDKNPKGILYLTDLRLFFEQREEVATKKFLGFFTTESEKIQKLLVELEVAHIEQIEDLEEKSGLFGMGKDEILSLVMSADSSRSRARFHLTEEDSTAWATLIKRVKNRDIDQDRADEYIEEVQEAEVTMGTFPAQCPGCFAPVTPPPRGVTNVSCEFCGSVIVATPSSKTS